MSNSNLVSYTKLSPHYTAMSDKVNKKITIHHMAGDLTIETCGNVFQNREASANYGIGSDGRIGMYVEEHNRAWTSANRENDSQAVTIEVANDEIGGNWHVSDKALASLIDLCVDICQRNGIDKLVYTGDKSGNLTRHNMFVATACPGPYLQSKFPYIAEEVNKRLGQEEGVWDDDLIGFYKITANGGLRLRTAPNTDSSVIELMPTGSRCRSAGYHVGDWYYVESANGQEGYCSSDYLDRIESDKPYQVKVTANALNYRNGPGTGYSVNGTIRDHGVYTIVEKDGDWGKLKSGAGWIHLGYTEKV